MRAVWKGTIGFGSYAVPVRAYAATEEHAIELHQVHEADGGRIRVKRVCEVDNAEVPATELVRGYPVPGGDVVLLTDEELDALPGPAARTIDVRGFVRQEQVDPLYFAKSYFLEPEPAGTKPYVLLAEALQQSGRLAMVKVALRRRELLGALRVRDQVIVLGTMLWPDEIRDPDFPFRYEDVDLRPGEVRHAVSLIEELTTDFDPGRYPDTYRDALEALIHAKIDGAELARPTAAEQAEGVTRLLAALQDNVDGDTRAAAVTKARAAAAKAARARAAAKKTAARVRH